MVRSWFARWPKWTHHVMGHNSQHELNEAGDLSAKNWKLTYHIFRKKKLFNRYRPRESTEWNLVYHRNRSIACELATDIRRERAHPAVRKTRWSSERPFKKREISSSREQKTRPLKAITHVTTLYSVLYCFMPVWEQKSKVTVARPRRFGHLVVQEVTNCSLGRWSVTTVTTKIAGNNSEPVLIRTIVWGGL